MAQETQFARPNTGIDDRSTLLASNELFRHLRSDQLAGLARYTRLQRFSHNQPIFRQQDSGSTLMAVISGRVRISRLSAAGKEVVFSILAPGTFFGEIALLDGGRRSADATALGNTELILLDRRDFMPFLKRNPAVAIDMLEVLCQRIRRTDEQVEDSLFLLREARLAKALLHLADQFGKETPDGICIDFPLSQRELGNFVGLTRESINKQLVEWREAGLIGMRGKLITIRDLDAIQNLLDESF